MVQVVSLTLSLTHTCNSTNGKMKTKIQRQALNGSSITSLVNTNGRISHYFPPDYLREVSATRRARLAQRKQI